MPAEGTVDTIFRQPTASRRISGWKRQRRQLKLHHAARRSAARVKYLTDAKYGEPFVGHRTKVHKPDTGQLEVGTLEVAGVPRAAPILKPGQARLIPAGSDLVFQMHHTTNGSRHRPQPHGFLFQTAAHGAVNTSSPTATSTFRPAPPTTRCRRR